MTRQEESVQLDLAKPKPWRRWIPSWLRSLIWVDFADKYDAFLSYSWKADSKTASVIHSVLQRFLCPWYKRRAKTIFRDLSCMPAGSSLENELFDRMDRSTHFVVLACPEAARSVGMEMEACHWFSRPREGQVLIIVTAGEFRSWDDIRDRTLPAAVQNNLASEPLWIPLQHRRAEILAATNRQMLHGQLIEDLKQIFVRLYAPRTWEELHGEERAQRRRVLSVVSVAALLLLGLATVAVWFARRAQMETAIAEENARESRARELAAYATVSLNEDPERSILLGMHAVSATVRFGQPPIPATEDALHQALLSSVRLTLRHLDSVNSASWSPSGKFLATGSMDGVATVWDTETGKDLQTFGGRKDSVNSVSWSPSGKLLAVGANSGTTTVWDTETGKDLQTFGGRKDSVNSVSWSPSGKLLAVGANSGTTTVWDTETGGTALILPSDGFPVLSVAWSPNGRRLATGSSWTAKVWDAANATRLQTLEGHLGDVYSVAWSGDGKWLATGSYDQTARIWDPENGEELSSLSDHRGSVRSVAWGPGERLATGGEDRTVKVWDSRKEMRVGHRGFDATRPSWRRS